MGFLIAILVILVLLVIAFAVWFILYKNSGKCPLCALEKLVKPTKITMSVENDEPYSNGTALTPPMGWSSARLTPFIPTRWTVKSASV